MPDSEAIIDGEGGRKVTITIAELTLFEQGLSADDLAGTDPNTFVIANGKYKLTITIAE